MNISITSATSVKPSEIEVRGRSQPKIKLFKLSLLAPPEAQVYLRMDRTALWSRTI